MTSLALIHDAQTVLRVQFPPEETCPACGRLVAFTVLRQIVAGGAWERRCLGCAR